MLEGQVILVQSADLVQSRKMIPDLAMCMAGMQLIIRSGSGRETTRKDSRTDGISITNHKSYVVHDINGQLGLCMIKISGKKQPINNQGRSQPKCDGGASQFSSTLYLAQSQLVHHPSVSMVK